MPIRSTRIRAAPPMEIPIIAPVERDFFVDSEAETEPVIGIVDVNEEEVGFVRDAVAEEDWDAVTTTGEDGLVVRVGIGEDDVLPVGVAAGINELRETMRNVLEILEFVLPSADIQSNWKWYSSPTVKVLTYNGPSNVAKPMFFHSVQGWLSNLSWGPTHRSFPPTDFC